MDAIAPALPPETPPATPLLPAFLQRPAAALWLWALPSALLLLLNTQAYLLIEGNMNAAQRHVAHLLGLAGLGSLLGSLVFYVFSRLRPLPAGAGAVAHALRGLAPLLVQAAYLWLAIACISDVLPTSVTAWIYPQERFLFNQFTFAMLPLFLGILHIACGRPAANTGTAIAINLGLGVGAPIALYLLFAGMTAVVIHLPFAGVLFAMGFVSLGIVMFIGIVRVTMLVLRRAEGWGARGERIAIAVFAFALPLGGLALNRSIPFPVDFQAWEVYALTVANVAILLLASCQHARRPRLSFLLLCATFPFSFYFFFVFLPYTPLSILAIIAFGLGFLVLTPTFLFVLHLGLLNKSLRAHPSGPSATRLWLAGVLCTLLLPGFFVTRALADRAALHAALDHVYAPVLESRDLHYPGTLGNLRRALASHRSYKNGIYYPLLSDFYSWLVFDNLVLPDDKLATLETTFLGAAGSNKNHDPLQQGLGLWGTRSVRDRHRAPRAVELPRTVEVSRLDLRAAPVAGAATTVTLALTLTHNAPDQRQAAEYVQSLPLPPGVFVNGFRLHINGTPVPGRIVEKKTALWVYSMIRDTERRDPGLLIYKSPTELELRVFPINPGTPTTVEIDFLVPSRIAEADLGPLANNPAVVLDRIASLLQPQLVRAERGTVVSGIEALHLPGVERETYLHLIIDRSADNAFAGDLAAILPRLQAQYPAARRARITLANFDVADAVSALTPLEQLPGLGQAGWPRQMPAAGGLSLDTALAHALRQHREADLEGSAHGLPPHPVFVVIGKTAKPRRLELPLTQAWCDVVQSLDLQEFGTDGTHVVQREGKPGAVPLLRVGDSVRPLVAGRALRFSGGDSKHPLEYYDSATAQWGAVHDMVTRPADSPWGQAVALQLRHQDHQRSPGSPGDGLPALVAASRASGILIPATSYIVVENSAQWKALEAGEKQKLGQNASLDFVETPAPPTLWIALGFGAWLVLRHRRRRA
jgi:hypothetical protein